MTCAWRELPDVAPAGYAVLQKYEEHVPEEEWTSLRYVDWKSGGDTMFAPLASATGLIDCKGFDKYGKPDRDGILVSENVSWCPTISRWLQRTGVNFGRVRVIRLNPGDEAGAMRCLHTDDNNLLNPSGEGKILRLWLQLTDDPGSCLVLKDQKDAPDAVRVPLPAGAQILADTERLWHVVHHPGPKPRFAVVASVTCDEALQAWVDRYRVF